MRNRAAFTALAVLVALVAGLLAAPGTGLDEGPWPLRVLSAGVVTLAAMSAAHPRAALIVAGVVALPVVVSALVNLVPRSVHKDPQRLFTAAQKRTGNELAGNRCEMESWLWMRCRGPAEHGDHWFPWSKGGASELGNYVAACARCNMAKSNRIPTRFETLRLERRRSRYYPTGTFTSTGSRYVTF